MNERGKWSGEEEGETDLVISSDSGEVKYR